jgi:hypothetical protein
MRPDAAAPREAAPASNHHQHGDDHGAHGVDPRFIDATAAHAAARPADYPGVSGADGIRWAQRE